MHNAEQVFVISDLHLGGGRGVPMCSPKGQGLLASFVRWVTAQHAPGRDAHFVIAGDVVDFLAETPSAAFTANEDEAAAKLEAIFAQTQDIWDALAGLVRKGAKLTVMVGNHDIELSLPRPRRLLRERLGVGRVEVLYDDEALRIGSLVIEHGNRYDDWNWVDHDQLRRVRRNLSRGEAADAFKVQPGSQLVVDVMNAVKAKFPFVDLLKPEMATVMPLLAFLDPGVGAALHQVADALPNWIAMRLRATAAGGDSTRSNSAGPGAPPGELADALHLVDQLAVDPAEWTERASAEGTRGVLDKVVAARAFGGLLGPLKGAEREETARLVKLHAVLIELLKSDRSLTVEHETSPEYLAAANNAADHGATVVVYGHTHLVKRVDLKRRSGFARGARYLNTGTWADLMAVPVAALSPSTPPEEALGLLRDFASDLSDRTKNERWRKQVPTFAHVEVGADYSISYSDADVYRYREDVSPAEMKAEMSIPDGTVDRDPPPSGAAALHPRVT